MSVYQMRHSVDCGPAMVLAMLQDAEKQVTYEELIKLWKFPVYSKLADLRDSPGAHWRIFKKFEIPWRKVTFNDIWEGRVNYKKTAVLVHSPDNPYTVQHWILLDHKEGELIYFQWGNGTIRTWNKESFLSHFIEGFPNCAYEIGEGSTKWTWEMSWDLFIEYLPWILTLILVICFWGGNI